MPRQTGFSSQEKPGAELLSGRQAVRVANTPISISTDAPGTTVIPIGVREVLVQADPGNQARVAVGDAMVTTVPARGVQLAAAESVTIAIDDVSNIFVNGPNVTEGVCWLAVR